jgi:hypothetical protein
MASLSNINGLFDVHSTGAILFSTSHGTSGQILRSNGNAAPTWVAASTVIGGPYLPLTGGTLIGPLSGTSATFSGDITLSDDLNFTTNGFADISNTGTGAMRFKPSSQTLALTLTGANATFAGNVTVGANAAGQDVLFLGETSGAYFKYDASEDGVVIVAPTDEVALGIRVVGGAQPTVPQFTVGRDAGQYLGIKVDDRISQVIHRQDETTGTMQMNQEIWDNGTGIHRWNWRSADGAGASASTKMTLNKTGELYLPGSVGIGEATPDGKLHIHQTGSGTSNTIITEDDARKIFIGRDSIKATDLNNNAQILHLQQNGGDAVFGGGIYLGGTATANKLDDYKEGAWTPTLKFSSGQVGITYAGAAGTVYRNGHYTKIGRVVTFSFRIILTSKGTSVGDATISGLPYDANGGLGNYGSAMYSFANNFLIPLRPTITIDSSSSIIRLRFVNSPNGNYGNVTNSDFNNNSDIILTGTYQST